MAAAMKTTAGPQLEPHQIILRPLVTEKGTHQFTHRNAYPFEVNPWANKDQIKNPDLIHPGQKLRIPEADAPAK